MMKRAYHRKRLVMLSMFDKFFVKNMHGNHKAKEQYIYSSSSKHTAQEAVVYWVKLAQKLVVGVINSLDHTDERIFILISFNENDSTIDIFFQMDGQLRMWNDLDNQTHKR